VGILLKELAEATDGELLGDPGLAVSGASSLTAATGADIVYIESPKYFSLLADCKAGVIVLSAEILQRLRSDGVIDDQQACLVVDNPHAAFARISQLFHPLPDVIPGVHASAVIHASASIADTAHISACVVIEENVEIGEHVSIAPGCWLGAGSRIGDRTRVHANVSIYPETSIGENCLIHAGAVIGSEGFGHARDDGQWIRLPQTGKVVIGDHVRIGANTTVDRGSLEDTVIGDGVKLDNGIQIGHNVQIGRDTAMAAHSAIGGSTRIGERCALGGLVGSGAHVNIADDVFITAMSGVNSDIKQPGAYSSTLQVMPAADWNRNFARFRQLDKLARQVRSIASKLKLSKGSNHD